MATSSTRFLTIGIAAAGFLSVVLIDFVAHTFLGIEGYPLQLQVLVGCTFFFGLGCLGIVWSVRQELPLIVTIRGWPAKLVGVIFTVLCWGFALYILGAMLLRGL